jgi:hypothetical protein
MDLPVLCTLSETELRERRATVLDSMKAETIEAVAVPQGYAYKFSATPEILSKLAHVISLEHQCCRFLTFKMILEAASDKVVLEITGPAEAVPVIADFFGG